MCTNLMISVPASPGQSETKMHVSARAMELPGATEWNLYAVPANQSWPLKTPPPQIPPSSWTTISWTSTIGFVGIGPSGPAWTELPTFSDGINADGLSIGALWMAPGTAYPQPDSASDCVSFLDMPAWILGTCSTVSDVKACLQTATVVGPPAPPPNTKTTPDDPSHYYVPLHYIVIDQHGDGLVIEFINQELRQHDCANGVLTNWPEYDWHTTNVLDYFNLNPIGTTTTVAGAGNPGGGTLLGLPGDPLSASRFAKATTVIKGFGMLPSDGSSWLPAPGLLPWATGPTPFAGPEQTAVTSALQLVQICMGTPYGMLLQEAANPDESPEPPASITTYGDFTMWSTVRDHTNRKYYVMPAFSGVLTEFDLNKIAFGDPPSYEDYASFPVVPPAQWREDGTSALSGPAAGAAA